MRKITLQKARQQYRTDAEWYANTVFPGEPGHYGTRNWCNTNGQTWPLGKWLDAPYSVAAN